MCRWFDSALSHHLLLNEAIWGFFFLCKKRPKVYVSVGVCLHIGAIPRNGQQVCWLWSTHFLSFVYPDEGTFELSLTKYGRGSSSLFPGSHLLAIIFSKVWIQFYGLIFGWIFKIFINRKQFYYKLLTTDELIWIVGISSFSLKIPIKLSFFKI